MVYQDRIYGEFKIEEPVILELISSKTLQRLKGIDQAGYPPLYYNPYSVPISELAHTRFEHSLGVYCLLRKFGASLEEQLAGLIHDVSHSVFSHCIDYVLDAGSEKEHSHQDNIFENFVKNSEIPSILKKYGINTDVILDKHNFSLLEKSLPDLCADRIDYSLRSGLIFKDINSGDLNLILGNLAVKNHNWVFKNFEYAKKYAELFFRMNSFYYAGLPSAVMFRTVGDTMRYALRAGYISENDLYTTDDEVLKKIKEKLGGDEKLRLLFERMNNQIKFQNDPKDYNAHVFCKSRVVDPFFEDNGAVKRVSGVDAGWKEILEREMPPKEYFIKFER